MANPSANLPVSSILKNKSSFEDEPRKKSREDWRKAKELEEARKAGTAPAAVDEEGKDINPHIPQYISATPWYFGAEGPTLKHQRPQPEKQKQFSHLDEWYKRGVDTSKVSVKYRKGACENCGAVTHKRKDCMERPRKVGAKFTNAAIAPDEFVQPDLSVDYDGKRDRWAGYDPAEHRAIVEEYQKIEDAKRQMRADKLNAEENDEQDSDKDEDKYVDEVDMPGTKVDSKQRITVRNLRIREDTAKYLRNLDPNSAYYDPKTRSMRDNPYAGTDQEVAYRGENYARFSGDTQQHAVAQLFAWDAHERGVDVHLLAEPTKLELLKQEYDKKRDELKEEARGGVIRQYGGEEHLQAPPAALLLAQTEDYVEYSRYGKIIKGQEKQVIRSKYEEDVYPNNHTTVWGSYWHGGHWGYKCCHSFVKNSYCTGDVGKQTADVLISGPSGLEEGEQRVEAITDPVTTEEKTSAHLNDNYEKKSRRNSESSASNKNSSESSNEEENWASKTERKKSKKKNKKKKQKEKRKNKKKFEQSTDKLKEALKKEVENQKEADRLLKLDERKRPYNSMFEVKEPTTEEIEAFQMKRKREEDPMAHFLNL
ncbi:pre-mRNA-splicing factor Slu7 [Athalia rosae]|uniref:pre-mRNA-splicing factor Slu7 n=1 Tax=Athalia rosae TaxID=37344 RepID=UPI0020341247|nr:pre-mRNA-splicing factor Slu7 [Athalia rosae]XP_048512306.1 pre-mRNA-splicing factor Slu7 [Athalia rosae]XP_048512312.1 pre-mRNA-splicing factor Slu7 [Athalia rosae]